MDDTSADTDPTAQDAGGDPPQITTTPLPHAAFDAWREGLGDAERVLLDDHLAALREGLSAGRAMDGDAASRDALQAIQAQLADTRGELAASRTMARAYQEATRPDVMCRQPRLALLAAQDDGLLDAEGGIDWSALRVRYPALFAAPDAHPGAGAHRSPAPAADMNAYIRRAAGRN